MGLDHRGRNVPGIDRALPAILQCVDYSSGFGARSPFVWSAETLSLTERLPEAVQGSTLRGPDRSPRPIRSTVVEGRTLLVAENLEQPGIYQLATPDRPRSRPALAVNLVRNDQHVVLLAYFAQAR